MSRTLRSAVATSYADGSTSAGQVAPALPRRGYAHALLATARPRQWIKNGLVIAAPAAAGALGHDDVPLRVLFACVAFCLLSSGIYAINDAHDADEDRLHPRKRHRPVAAGELSVREAKLLGVALMLTGLGLCAVVRPLLAFVGLGYLVLTVSYTHVWRHIVILDVIAISGGFVLRAVAGGVAAPVTLSRWFLIVVSAAAILIAAGRRFAELRAAERGESGRRRVLHVYDAWLLATLMVTSTVIALVAYVVWALQLPLAHGVPWRLLTVAPVFGCVLRYGWLVRAGAGEAPEEMILGDRGLQLAGLAWVLLFALAVHAAS